MDKVPARPHKNYRMVDTNIKLALQQASNDRVAKNSDFEKLLTKIEAYVKQKEEKSISLKESTYMASRKELTTEKVEEEQLEAKAERNAVYYKGFYNQEVLNIASDYISLLQQRNSLANQSSISR
jgi:carboxyl-terminal processing protease